ncbi:cell division protein FtsQ/DivIB [Geomicrobium sp. JCM 19039]|uniref:cell division protein FtsQ/DivIB n=1 Tax=Geomicrobium sp. JCM 19039 TaxID=1460636 RepID=UPI00045F46DA|nr:FtsQ-type POTRA domain-containing protein [Geomicrobium sp. JCM 19039]GAK14517.1 cell division protein FtsQ [Geomicrobium sp. JCM 19039]
MSDDQKVISVQDRIPALKEQRKKRANRRLILYVSIFFILIAAVVYFQSPLSHIQTIQVEGQEIGEEQEILSASSLETGTSIWSADFDAAEQSITQIPYVDSVEVRRSLPTTVRIVVNERERAAYIEQDGQFIPVYGNGNLMEEQSLSTHPSDAPVIYNWTEERLLELFFEELNQLGDGIVNHISEIHPLEDDPTHLRLYMNDGIEVETTVNQFADHMTSYPTIARQISAPEDGVLHMKMSLTLNHSNGKKRMKRWKSTSILEKVESSNPKKN